MYLIGYDIGTSSIKATLLDGQSGTICASATSPRKEMKISAPNAGWAEQDPVDWWQNVKIATNTLISESGIDPGDIRAIGLTYQMHGLVCVDKDLEVIRPSIIWCDSRAVEIGQKATSELGESFCLENLLNYPGNFTASKLKWVMENEPDNYSRIFKVMLPGDYIALKMTGRITTTETGLSEGILWNFKENRAAKALIDHYGFSSDLFAEIVPTFGEQGALSATGAEELGLKEGTMITYRAGDQPNNALSLGVLEPGDIAATAGTSGVVYGIGDKPNYDKYSRVNTFLHVNHLPEKPRLGVLLCVNGTGICNSWLKHNVAGGDYPQMDALAAKAPIGSDGLVVLPFGNGAERTLGNRDINASIAGLNFNRHTSSHLLRAAQEGIVFALKFGLDIMNDMGIQVKTVKAGHANMFLSDIFAKTFASITQSVVQLYNTDGSQGAARGAGIGAGIYKDGEAFVGLEQIKTIEPDASIDEYSRAYENWLGVLKRQIDM